MRKWFQNTNTSEPNYWSKKVFNGWEETEANIAFCNEMKSNERSIRTIINNRIAYLEVMGKASYKVKTEKDEKNREQIPSGQ